MKVKALDQFNYKPNVSFTSQDESIATVQADGTIRGIASGKTTVVVADKDNPDFKTDVTVIVSPSITPAQAQEMNDNHFSAIDDSNLTAMVDHEVYEKTVYKNDVLHSYICESEVIVASREDAYFGIIEDDAEIETDEGSLDFRHYEMVITTNEFYDTFFFKQTGDTKNYLQIATQSYMGNGERVDPVLDIMNSWFTSGDGLFAQVYQTAQVSYRVAKLLGTEETGLVSNLKYGSRGDGCIMMSYTYPFDDPATKDDEDRYGIPANTPMMTYQTARFMVENDRVVGVTYDLEEFYEIDGDQYHGVYSISHCFEDIDENKSQIRIPDKKDYTRVDTLFDL